jgi:hypothetical protein
MQAHISDIYKHTNVSKEFNFDCKNTGLLYVCGG